MAVLHFGQGTNDCGGDRKPRSHDGPSGWRRRVRAKNPVALRREQRGYRLGLPGDVQEQRLPGLFAFGMVDPHSARTRHGTPEYRQGNIGRNSERRTGDRIALAVRKASETMAKIFLLVVAGAFLATLGDVQTVVLPQPPQVSPKNHVVS